MPLYKCNGGPWAGMWLSEDSRATAIDGPKYANGHYVKGRAPIDQGSTTFFLAQWTEFKTKRFVR